MASINSSGSAVTDLKAEIDATTKDIDGIPGLVVYTVNKNGEYIFEHEAGKVGQGMKEEMSSNSLFWIASCTKLITSIAAMQLVEQGKLALDDVAMIEKIAPELRDVKVLNEDGQLVEKRRGITLRLLLNHTAGFSYSFFSERLKSYGGSIGVAENSGRAEDILNQPLVNQPGERYEYGVSIDWVGEIVSRVSGLTLEEYFKKHITGPLGIGQDITLLPDQTTRKDLVYTHYRDPTGKIKINDDGPLWRPAVIWKTQEEAARLFQSGGAGGFARPKAYCQILSVLLNDGVHAPSGKRILKHETIEEIFTNQLPDMPNFGRQGGPPPSKPFYSNPLPEMYPEPGNPPQGWSLVGFMHLEDSFIHSRGTVFWSGLPNLFWWCDREKGIAGIVGSQIVPFGDLKVITLWMSIEQALYANLVQPKSG